jgi:hypothetical protein
MNNCGVSNKIIKKMVSDLLLLPWRQTELSKYPPKLMWWGENSCNVILVRCLKGSENVAGGHKTRSHYLLYVLNFKRRRADRFI